MSQGEEEVHIHSELQAHPAQAERAAEGDGKGRQSGLEGLVEAA